MTLSCISSPVRGLEGGPETYRVAGESVAEALALASHDFDGSTTSRSLRGCHEA